MMQFSQPPPPIPNVSGPPPQHHGGGGGGVFFPRFGGPDKPKFYQSFRPYPRPGADNAEFDGKRLRKSVMRKTVDYNAAVTRMLENRVWQRDWRDRRALQPDMLYCPELLPPSAYPENASNSITTRFVKTATNKMRCPVFCLAWTPEGRRLVTGASSGEFTLWNGLTFNFETILQAHDSPVRTMVWSHNDVWMVTGDHGGYVKYWQSNMNNVKMFQAHKDALRGISFSPTDQKLATCSDDGTIRVWDFLRCQEERMLRGHGADVKCIHWHPQKGLIVSGSKDNQQPVKIWDPKTGQSLATLHAHKSTVMDVRWNDNGNWLVTASRDHLLKLFDIRNLSSEVQTFRGHKKEASAVAWHPQHEGLFCSGGSDGSILFWHVGADKEIGAIEAAHDSIVWSLAWHPMGHILCSGSNDHTSKFWTRNRPGDQMRDKYNLNTLPAGASGYDDNEVDDQALIPGMGPEDKVEAATSSSGAIGVAAGLGLGAPANADPNAIPGLDFDPMLDSQKPLKKVPYAKPIPKNFQAHWNETKREDEDEEGGTRRRGLSEEQMAKVIADFIERNPPPGVIPLSEVQPDKIILYGKMLPVSADSSLSTAISQGIKAIEALVETGEIPEAYEAMQKIREGAMEHDDEDEDANLELRPEEHESYDGDGDYRYREQFDDFYGAPWSEQDEMNFDGFGPNNFGPNNFGPGGPNMGGPPFGGGYGPPGNFGPDNFSGPHGGNFGPNMDGPNNFGSRNFGPGNMCGPGPNMGPGNNFGGPNNFGPGGNFNGPPNNFGPGNFGPGNFGSGGGGSGNFGPGFDPRVGPAVRSSNFSRGGRGGRGDGGNFRGGGQRGGGDQGNWNRPPWEQGGGGGGGGGGGDWSGPGPDQSPGNDWDDGRPDNWRGSRNEGGRGGMNREGNKWGGDGGWRGGRGGGDGPPQRGGNWRGGPSGGRGGGDGDGNWGRGGGERRGGGFNRRSSGRSGSSGNWGGRGGPNN